MAKNRENVESQMIERAMNLGLSGIQVQWVEGDSSKAEDSFFNINQKASPIGETEIRLLKARKTPNRIAARAIMRSGNGHKYWSNFSQDNQEKVEEISKEIHELIFKPKLKCICNYINSHNFISINYTFFYICLNTALNPISFMTK